MIARSNGNSGVHHNDSKDNVTTKRIIGHTTGNISSSYIYLYTLFPTGHQTPNAPISNILSAYSKINVYHNNHSSPSVASVSNHQNKLIKKQIRDNKNITQVKNDLAAEERKLKRQIAIFQKCQTEIIVLHNSVMTKLQDFKKVCQGNWNRLNTQKRRYRTYFVIRC